MSIYTVTDQLNPVNALVPLNLSKIKFLVLHHIDAISATWQDINQWHKENGWSCFGYNEYIRKDGTVYIGRGDNVGAQCLGYNSCSYGIALEGNYDTETEMPDAQYKALIERIKYNLKRFPANTSIVPHSALVETSCPGKNLPLVKIMSEGTNVTNDFMDTLNVLVSMGIIKSPDYWLMANQPNAMLRGDYVKILIENFVKAIKK